MEYKNSKELFDNINISLTQEQYNKFIQYEELLVEWNQKMNLTAITDDNDIWIKHFLDSSTIEKYIDKDSSIIDVGTGAGFPGIPLLILRNDIKVTLLDSLNKRINFLQAVCNELKLKDVKFVHGRAEDIAKDINYRERFDVVTARAVANLSTLLELCIPFVRVGGLFICMKSVNADEEINIAQNSLKEMGAKIVKVDDIKLANSDIDRKIIIIRKEKETKAKYPRKAGIPTKQPL